MLQSMASVGGKMPFDHNIIRYMHTNENACPCFSVAGIFIYIKTNFVSVHT